MMTKERILVVETALKAGGRSGPRGTFRWIDKKSGMKV